MSKAAAHRVHCQNLPGGVRRRTKAAVLISESGHRRLRDKRSDIIVTKVEANIVRMNTWTQKKVHVKRCVGITVNDCLATNS